MAKYIEKSEIYRRYFNNGCGVVRLHVSDIDVIPAADVAPVVHGRWIDNGITGSMLSVCSECGFTFGAYSFKYYHNCGAKMDREDADGD